jgi:hypothetical protein
LARYAQARQDRDAALVRAVRSGLTPYTLAKRLRIMVGEDNALTAERIRQIAEGARGVE